jgi:Domain of unknown function (DUF4438), N-terminal/Domain of unknown function (DUF4438), C-terminal
VSAQQSAVAVNLLGTVEHPELGDSPYRVDAGGAPYVPVGDGGLVLGLELGDSVFALDGDHTAPGACLTHSDEAARHALVLYSCIGNEAEVRTGAAAGARGAVIGKRGESGRVIVGCRASDLAAMAPGDQVRVRTRGQGFRPAWLPEGVTMLNLDPDLLDALPVSPGDETMVSVRMVLPSMLAGNGLGRPAAGWDLDLQLGPGDGQDLRLGDLVAITDIDARYNMGYRRDWLSIGITMHASSPLPGHGPGITPILTGPRALLAAREDRQAHIGLTAALLKLQ